MRDPASATALTAAFPADISSPLKGRVAPLPLQERPWFKPAVAALFLLVSALALALSVARKKLAEYASRLKERVYERTAELARTNLLLEAREKELLKELAERQTAEESLRASEDRYRDLVENANDIIYTHDLQGNFTSLNRMGERITGYSREEALRMNVSEVVAPRHLALVRRKIEDKLREGAEAASTYELEILAKDGRKLILEVSSRLIFDKGKPVGVEGIGRNITDRKTLEEELRQSQKMEAVGRLAGGVAHDFNNLLTAILGHSELLLANPSSDPRVREDVEEIKKAGERAASLTRQLLAFSRKQILESKILDLNVVVASMERMLGRLIGEDIHLSTVKSPDLGPVRADQSQIEQVILNLAINARDAMPDGGYLTIGTSNVDLDDAYVISHTAAKPGPYVLIAISDTGLGMDAATQLRIFEPFFTTKEQGKGTGLGLSTVYGIVKQSDGYIWVYSERGHGTTFKIYLPRVCQPGERKEASAMTVSSTAGTETLLVVEDEQAVRSLVTTVLRRQGYTVLEAADGPSALEIAERHAGLIHMTLTDTVMPLMSGSEFARRLCALRPETRVLFMSGYTEDAIVRHGVLSEGASFLQKPFTPDALVRKIREVLEH